MPTLPHTQQRHPKTLLQLPTTHTAARTILNQQYLPATRDYFFLTTPYSTHQYYSIPLLTINAIHIYCITNTYHAIKHSPNDDVKDTYHASLKRLLQHDHDLLTHSFSHKANNSTTSTHNPSRTDHQVPTTTTAPLPPPKARDHNTLTTQRPQYDHHQDTTTQHDTTRRPPRHHDHNHIHTPTTIV